MVRRATIFPVALVFLLLVGMISTGAAVTKKNQTAKELLLLEINALQQEVTKDRWTSAWTRYGRIAVYWARYRHAHPEVKKGVVDRFTKSYRNLQAHLRRKDKIRIYYELGVLRALVIILKA